MKTNRRTFVGGAAAAAVLSGSRVAFAQKKYDDGATDKEIKIGHTNPYSGPASSYGVIGSARKRTGSRSTTAAASTAAW